MLAIWCGVCSCAVEEEVCYLSCEILHFSGGRSISLSLSCSASCGSCVFVGCRHVCDVDFGHCMSVCGAMCGDPIGIWCCVIVSIHV